MLYDIRRLPYKFTYPLIQLGSWRWASVLLAGIIARLLIDTIFALQDPGYRLFSIYNLPNYIYTVLFAFIILEGNRLINRKLDDMMPWEMDTTRRFGVQALANAVYSVFILNALRPAVIVLFIPEKEITASEQIVVNMVAIGLVLIVALIDFGVFLLARWRTSLAETERFKKESAEFHLSILKSQISPHFLFNSLNTLSSLVYSDQEKAADFVRQLAKVYRYVLENRERALVPLQEELKFLKDYMDLQTTRFGDAISYSVEVPAKALKLYIAPLTLQLLLEKAIKHNSKTQRQPLNIRIYLDEHGKLVVVNNMKPKKQVGFSSGIGLNNIKSRYDFLTDEKVEIMQNEQQFSVKIPLLESE